MDGPGSALPMLNNETRRYGRPVLTLPLVFFFIMLTLAGVKALGAIGETPRPVVLQ